MDKKLLNTIMARNTIIKRCDLKFVRDTGEFAYGILKLDREINSTEKVMLMDALAPALPGNVESVRKGTILCIFNADEYAYVTMANHGLSTRFSFHPRK